jgi:N-acetylneuraminic acid mutarotase
MPEGRAGHAMVTFGNRIYVFGGAGRTKDTLVFDGHKWTRAAPLPVGRNHLRAVVWGNRIWVIGGRSSHLSSRIDIYDPATDHFQRGPDLPKPMSAMAVAVLDNTLHVVGGENPPLFGGAVVADHFILPAGSTHWEKRPAEMLPVHGAAFGYVPGVMFVAGGATRQGALSVLSWTNVTQFFTTIPEQLL